MAKSASQALRVVPNNDEGTSYTAKRKRSVRAPPPQPLVSADACNALVFVAFAALFAAWILGL